MVDIAAPPESDAAHDLLLRLAGRLPDAQLWRFRDWLAADAVDAVAASLPLTLLRERIPISAQEARLLASLRPDGDDMARLGALPWVDEIAEVDYTFSPESPERVNELGDSVAVVLGAVLRHRSEVISTEIAWRTPRTGGEPKRVLLITVTANARRAALTGELQRVMRALGDYEPGVEVLGEGRVPSAYHHAALAASTPLYEP